MVSALDGIRVLDVTQGMAGALATMFLSDHGARVIRIEPAGGDPERREPGYRLWDRGKESVFLDLSAAISGTASIGPSSGTKAPDEEPRVIFERLVDGADVLVESYSPSSPYQELVDYSRLSSINPRLVHCSITAYGPTGPLKDEPAENDLVMARTGILTSQPSFRPGPVHVVHPIPSLGAGVLAAQGIVASLFAREKTGRGRHLGTSLMAGVLANSPKAAGEKLRPWSGRQSRPTGEWAFYSVFECADGEWVQLGCIHDGFVERAIDALGVRERVSGLEVGRRYSPTSEQARAQVYQIVSEAIKMRPYEEWEAAFEKADVPYAPVRTIEEAMSDPQVRFNDMVVDLEDPEVGLTSQMGLPNKLLGTPGRVGQAAPKPGQHTSAVLAEVPTDRDTPRPAQEAAPDTIDSMPLSGVRVLAIENVIAGPVASRLLADLGADVVKMEPLHGDISRSSGSGVFCHFNCNKRSVSVNAKEPEGRDIVQRLAKSADVILENMRSGAAGRIGLGAEELEKLNPDVVYAHITGFGSTGPYSHRPGLDPLAQALTGLQRAQAGPGNPPSYLAALAPADYVGAMLGALGAVLALFAKARTGVGQRAETSLLNAGILVGVMGQGRLGDKGQYGRNALYRLYETQEGWLYVIAENPQEWTELCRVLGRRDLDQDERFSSADARRENDTALARELAQVFKERAAAEWVSLLIDAGVLCAPAVDGYAVGFFSDPQAAANEMIVTHEHPKLGQLKFSTRPITFHNTKELAARVTPLLGQHNREVLGELGYSDTQIEELYQKGIVRTEEPDQD